ncbi:maestro heat-like repeat-containing protein family member 7 [Buteo buteo]|uniref:maestro heat-like repeat-containing protein family member 7 n=1 Tax=Buteo buteo TaxID=30397 RepID=UPI003EB69C72
MAERPPSVPRLAWVAWEEEEKGTEDAPAWQPDEVEEVQLLQADPDWNLPEEQEHAQALFHSSAQKFWESLEPSEREDATIAAVEGMADSDSYDAEACAAMLDVLVESDASRLQHVPSIVRCIYRWLVSNTHVSAEHRLDNSLLELTHAHPHDVAVTLLRCAPSCDRAAATMWRVMVSGRSTAEQVLRELVCVLEDWPLHSTCTSDGDSADVFALAATRVLQEILRLPRRPRRLDVLFPRIFLALLCQIFFATKQMPEEVDTFWRGCQQEGCPPTNPSRFAMLTVKALLCRLDYDDMVFEVECKRGWDTLLSAETHHCAMGLLARQVCGISRRLCYRIAGHLVKLLRRKKQLWEVPAMAFLVELLVYPNVRRWGDNILQLVPTYLQSKCRVMRRLVLRGLLALCKTPLMARRMQPLLQRLIDLLMDADGEVVGMSLSVLSKVLRATGIPIGSPITLQLADRLRPLFDSDTNHVQLLSMHLFRDVMEFVVEEGKKPLKQHVHRSLIPLLCHLHDENQHVAEASRETLLQAIKFLKNRKLQQLLEREQTWVVGKYLLAEYSSRVDEYLQQCVLYLQSPQASMREAAIMVLGLAGRHVAHQQVKLQVIYKALQSTTKDVSDSVSSLASQTLFLLRAAERNPPSRFRLQVLQERFRRAWRRRPSLWDIGFLCCWSSVQS